MKKVKLAIMTTAIFLSIGAALAVRANTDCTFNTQYYLNGSTYATAGTYGVTFYCVASSEICTYIYNGSTYAACRQGTFMTINAKGSEKAAQKK